MTNKEAFNLIHKWISAFENEGFEVVFYWEKGVDIADAKHVVLHIFNITGDQIHAVKGLRLENIDQWMSSWFIEYFGKVYREKKAPQRKAS